MKRLSPIDSAFLQMESTRTPMHVGCLLTFHLPENPAEDFFRQLVAQIRDQAFMPPPFNCRLARSLLSRVSPAWEECQPDMTYHVRHSALPRPGGERELGVLVERLHSHPLDFDRPLWEAHIIEGLSDNRFAFYFKAHHCAIDGAGAMRVLRQWLSSDPDASARPGFTAAQKPGDAAAATGYIDLVTQGMGQLRDQVRGVGELAWNLVGMSRGEHSMVQTSMATPPTVFNERVWQPRRLGTQLLPLPRVKAIAKHLGVSVNDVTLAICGGATRAYLQEHNSLPDVTLTASVPIALDRKEGDDTGNAVAGFVCPLATDVSDPIRRVERIHAATQRAKQELGDMSQTALNDLALMGLGPLILGQMTGTLSHFPPIFNFVVSNVVLSRDKLYLQGAALEAMYPMSFLFDGYALNVTVVGYDENVAVGFIGCRDTVPSLQSLAVNAGDALAELEVAAGLDVGVAR